MSNSLVPKNDPGSKVVSNVAHDSVTAGIAVATVVAYSMIPVFGWVALIAGGGYILVRATKKGLKNR